MPFGLSLSPSRKKIESNKEDIKTWGILYRNEVGLDARMEQMHSGFDLIAGRDLGINYRVHKLEGIFFDNAPYLEAGDGTSGAKLIRCVERLIAYWDFKYSQIWDYETMAVTLNVEVEHLLPGGGKQKSTQKQTVSSNEAIKLLASQTEKAILVRWEAVQHVIEDATQKAPYSKEQMEEILTKEGEVDILPYIKMAILYTFKSKHVSPAYNLLIQAQPQPFTGKTSRVGFGPMLSEEKESADGT